MKPDNYESNVLLGLAATLTGGGIILFLMVLISGLKVLPERLPSQQFPGSITLDCPEVGTVMIFAETEGVQEPWGAAALEGLFQSLNINAVGPDGKQLTIAFFQSDMSYNLGVRKGRALATFPVPLEGSYEVSIEFRDPGAQQTQVLSFGLNFGTVLLKLVLTCFLAFALPLGLAVMVGVAAIKKRNFSPAHNSLHQTLLDRFEAVEGTSGSRGS